jgi:rhodanese-related sulfurtransferase
VRLARIGFDAVSGYLTDPSQLFVGRPDLVESSSRLTIEQLAEALGQGPGIQLVDVRNPGETAAGTLAGARRIPLAVLVDSLDQLDREAPVVVNCAGGYRSLVAASVLRHAGFADVSDLIGGYGAWTAAGLPVEGDGRAPEMAVQVGPLVAEEMLHGGAVLVDVREKEEWSAGHAPEALFIPMGHIEARIDEIPTDRTAVIVCRSGGRSNAVTQLLTSHGVDAVNLAGGMHAWEQAGFPVVTDAGEPGRIV